MADVHLHDVPQHVVTCMRHALMADVPVQAVHRVRFHQYECPIEDEMVAMRFGGLAVTGLEPAKFWVDVTAPPRAPLTWVTDRHLQGPDAHRVVRHPAGPVLLAPLLAGQTLRATCRTALGTGRAHTKWTSVHPVVRETGPDQFTLTLKTTGAPTASLGRRRTRGPPSPGRLPGRV